MTASTPEREPEHRDVQFDAPPGVHAVEPDGDGAPAPDADTGGDAIDAETDAYDANDYSDTGDPDEAA